MVSALSNSLSKVTVISDIIYNPFCKSFLIPAHQNSSQETLGILSIETNSDFISCSSCPSLPSSWWSCRTIRIMTFMLHKNVDLHHFTFRVTKSFIPTLQALVSLLCSTGILNLALQFFLKVSSKFNSNLFIIFFIILLKKITVSINTFLDNFSKIFSNNI